MSFYVGNSTPPIRYEGITMSDLVLPFLLTLIPFLILPYFVLVLYVGVFKKILGIQFAFYNFVIFWNQSSLDFFYVTGIFQDTML